MNDLHATKIENKQLIGKYRLRIEYFGRLHCKRERYSGSLVDLSYYLEAMVEWALQKNRCGYPCGRTRLNKFKKNRYNCQNFDILPDRSSKTWAGFGCLKELMGLLKLLDDDKGLYWLRLNTAWWCLSVFSGSTDIDLKIVSRMPKSKVNKLTLYPFKELLHFRLNLEVFCLPLVMIRIRMTIIVLKTYNKRSAIRQRVRKADLLKCYWRYI